MLVRLIKHEFYATRRILWPIFLGMAGLTVLVSLLYPLTAQVDSRFLHSLLALLFFAFFYAMLALQLAPLFLSALRFKRNFLQDEGYLTMTLPVSLHQQLAAKLLISAAWYVAVFCVSCLLTLWLFGRQAENLSGLWQNLSRGLEELHRIAPTPWTEELFHLLLALLECLLVVMLGITLVSLVVYASYAIGYSRSKHRSLRTVLLLYVFFHVVTLGGAGMWFSLLNKLDGLASGETVWAIHLFLASPIPCLLLFGAIFYAITYWFLTHRLNLE